jgi:hypothetical protein
MQIDKKHKSKSDVYEELHEMVRMRYIDLESSRCPSIVSENAFLS